jgi:hypothetical protein
MLKLIVDLFIVHYLRVLHLFVLQHDIYNLNVLQIQVLKAVVHLFIVHHVRVTPASPLCKS